MNEKKSDKTFGDIALERGFITKEQLDQALKIQTDEDIPEVGHRPIGRILLNEGFITLQQVGEVLKSLDKLHEEDTDKTFGDIALEKGFITKDEFFTRLKLVQAEYNKGKSDFQVGPEARLHDVRMRHGLQPDSLPDAGRARVMAAERLTPL